MFTGAGVRALSVSTSPPDAVFVVHGHLDPRCFMRLSSQRRHPQLSSGKVCSQRPCHPYRGELFLGNHSAVATCCHRLNWVDSKRDPRTPAAPWALWLLLALSCLFSRCVAKISNMISPATTAAPGESKASNCACSAGLPLPCKLAFFYVWRLYMRACICIPSISSSTLQHQCQPELSCRRSRMHSTSAANFSS